MAEPRSPFPSPSSPPNRLKVLWRVLLISNFALSAYMFATVRKKDLEAENDLRKLERDPIEKHNGYENTEIPSTFMDDATSIVTDNILEDQKQEPFYSVHGWREKLGLSKK